LRALAGWQKDTDMTGPSWLAGMFAALMIITAAYSAGRLGVSRLRRRATEIDADALHAVMGVAMAGMLVPRLNVLPNTGWAAVFAVAAAWFGWRALHTQGPDTTGSPRCRYPVPHLIESIAMLYMLLPLHTTQPARGQAGTAMPGMAASAGPAADSFPALAVVLALFMVGYIVWTTDRLTSLARARTTAACPSKNRDHQSAAAVAITAPRRPGGTPGLHPAGTQSQDPAPRPVLAPKLAACGKIAMGITMGYMLILML
jgi:hypothetical protein